MTVKLKSLDARVRFATRGIDTLNGMLQSGSLSVIWSLLEIQDYMKVTGNIAEIGVHQGKLFLLLCHWMNRGEIAHAIDIFGRPIGSDTKNIDKLIGNLEQFGIPKEQYRVEISDSTQLSCGALRNLFRGPNIRLFSVDGDHSREAVLMIWKLPKRSSPRRALSSLTTYLMFGIPMLPRQFMTSSAIQQLKTWYR